MASPPPCLFKVRVAEFEKLKHWTSVQLDPIAGSNDWEMERKQGATGELTCQANVR